MILADTSVWIDLLSRRPRLKLQADDIPGLAVCPPVLQEVLQGISDDLAATRIRRSLESFAILDENVPANRYWEAAEIYRLGRRKGITIRSSIDCLIAAIALASRAEVWHQDRDFEAIAKFTALKTRSTLNR